MAGSTAPRVSILLPVRDAAATLPACLRSVQRQVEPDWECLVVDDGSRDDSARVAHRFAAHDGRFRALVAPDRGLVHALNHGLAHCRAALVARLDADDLMHRLRLREQAALLEAHPGWAGVGCHVRLFPRDGLGRGSRAYERWINSIRTPADVAREAFVECPLAHTTWMMRHTALTVQRYRRREWPEDYDLLLRLVVANATLGVLPRRRVAWRWTAEGLSRRSPRYGADRFTACKAHFLARSFLAGSERYVLWGYGGTGRALRRALARHGKRPEAIVEVHAGRLGQRIHGAPVVPREALSPRSARPLVVSVAGEAARTEIRQALARLGFAELRDFVCAA